MALLIFVSGLLLLGPTLHAKTLQQLEAAGEIRVSSELQAGSTISPYQQLTLLITLETSGWFSGGTQLTLPEVPGLIVVQREKFAVNSTVQHQGKSWTKQDWEVSLFPQRAGTFLLPPIQLAVSVNHTEAGIVKGSLSTQALEFVATLPDAMKNVEHWLASSSLTVKRSISHERFLGRPGEALSLHVIASADNVLPMMLPPFTALNRPVPGLGIYPQTPDLAEHKARGANTVSRSERIDIVVEKSGHYTLPAMRYDWWNTDTHTHEIVVLPAVVIKTGHEIVELPLESDEAATQPSSVFSSQHSRTFLMTLVLAVVTLILILAVLYVWRKRSALSQPISKHKMLAFAAAAARKNRWVECSHWLYQVIDRYPETPKSLQLRAFAAGSASNLAHINALLSAAYRGNSHPQIAPSLKDAQNAINLLNVRGQKRTLIATLAPSLKRFALFDRSPTEIKLEP